MSPCPCCVAHPVRPWTATGMTYNERLAKIREAHPRAYRRWESREERKLWRLYGFGLSILDLSRVLRRQPTAIRVRLGLDFVPQGSLLTS